MSEYRFRVVRNRNELIEKIRIFDDELDDRVIEMLKLLVWPQISPDSDVEPPPNRFFYHGRRSRRFRRDELDFVLIHDSGDEQLYHTQEAEPYKFLADSLASASSQLLGDKGTWRIIGQEFALQLASSILEGGLSADPADTSKSRAANPLMT